MSEWTYSPTNLPKCFWRRPLAKLGFAVISMEDEYCCVRQDFENASSVSEKHFPVTTLKSGILLQQFSFTLPAMITASSVKHMSAEKSVGESITEAKARKYGMLNITSFYVSGDAVFFFFLIE